MQAPQLFSVVTLSEQETLQGTLMSLSQMQVIQNHQVQIAQEILTLTYSGQEKDHEYGLTLVYKQGQLDFATMLLANSREANIAIGLPVMDQLYKEDRLDSGSSDGSSF